MTRSWCRGGCGSVSGIEVRCTWSGSKGRGGGGRGVCLAQQMSIAVEGCVEMGRLACCSSRSRVHHCVRGGAATRNVCEMRSEKMVGMAGFYSYHQTLDSKSG